MSFSRIGKLINVIQCQKDAILVIHEHTQDLHQIVKNLLEVCKSHEDKFKKMEDKNGN